MDLDEQIAAHERRFEQRGLPLLIEGYSASEDVFTRAFPLLALIFSAEVLGTFDLSWPLWANLLAVSTAVALATGVIALINRHRGRGALALPSDFTDELEATFAERAEYLALLERQTAPSHARV